VKKLLFCLLLLTVLCAVDANDKASALQITKTNIFNYAGVSHVVRTSDRMIHLVWQDEEGKTSRILYSRSFTNGQTWSAPRAISTGFSYAKTPVIVVDSSDKLSVFWENSGAIYVTESLNKGVEWGNAFKVSGKFNEGSFPAAVVSDSGDIQLVWENAGSIFYRMYSSSLATWSTIYALNNAQRSARLPVITNQNNEQIIVAWVSQGEIVCRTLEINNNQWGKEEEVSLDANKYLSTPGSCENPILTADSSGLVHCFWTSKQQLLHRVRNKGYWSPIINRLSQRYYQGVATPVAVADGIGAVYCSYVEDNAIIIQQFDGSSLTWKKVRALKPKSAKILFSPLLVANNGYNNSLFNYQTGYDLVWLEKAVTAGASALVRYDVQSKFQEPLNAPRITTVENSNGYPAVSWTAPANQTGFQIIVSNRNVPSDPLLFDTRKIDSSGGTYTLSSFPLKDIPLYFFVRLFNDKGQWSEWSSPYLLRNKGDEEGPELEVTGIDEDSLFLYSPNSETLYYGSGIDQPREFVIRGKVIDRGSGIKKLTFSPAFGDAPPPLYDLTSEDWAVRYTLKSSDEPATIIITAYDNSGRSVSKIVSVLKDKTPPDPASWVTIYPDKDFADRGVTGNKQDNDRTVYINWTPGKDTESGIRYHLMGISQKWWQNAIHQPGDAEEGQEGDNTFYVFAVDNVGNVSLPSTDKIFIDSIPPSKPILIATVTSGNYFYGRCSTDSVQIYVNGVRDDVEIYAPGVWRYKHQMRDGQKELFSFQAVDRLGNKSEPLETRLAVDKTPPAVYYVDHNTGDKILRVNDTLVVLLKGDPKNKGYFTIPGLAKDVPLYDDGTRGDITADDGTYTGTYKINTELNFGKLDIEGTLFDQVGNSTTRKSLKSIQIDSSQPVVVDDFENKGDIYPWKNHCTARNISKDEDQYVSLGVPQGQGCLRVDYDLNGEQAWAGLASGEFMPKNLSGSRVYLNFWLKGSGSPEARLYIYLQGKKPRNISAELKQIEPDYSIPLRSETWQKVSLPVDKRFIDDLEQVSKYQLFVYSSNEKDKGTFYLDEFTVSYLPGLEAPISLPTKYIPSPKNIPGLSQAEKNIPVQTKMAASFIDLPYLQVDTAPNPAVRGEKINIKIKLPENLNAQEVVVSWGTMNGVPVRLNLAFSGGFWRKVWQIPSSFRAGEQFGQIFIKSKTGVYKKQFIYRVLADKKAGLPEYISCNFYPHPVILLKETSIKISIPVELKAKTVGVFFGETKVKIYSAELKRTGRANGRDVWQGGISLPGDMSPGSYSAVIYVKTQDGRVIRREAFYSVRDNSAR
jgi:hypothetical protein